MANNSIPVIKFLFRSDFKVLNDALRASAGLEVEEFPSASDLATYLSTVPAGLIISSLQEKNDLIQIATFMKIVKKTAPDAAFKIVVINFSGNKQFEKAIAKLGIQDMVEPGVNTKALKFKMDFWMKSLNAQVKNNPNAQNKVKSLDANKAQDKKTAENTGPNWLPQLELEDDIWILKQDSDCKKVLSKWLIRLMGPSPYIGQWTEVKSNLWRFDVKESEKEMFVPGNGAWFFFGDQKPDFVWKENTWLISGTAFDLFYKDGEQIFSRLKLKDKVLSICKNSLYAKTKEQVIVESFDKELVFKKEAQNLQDLEGKGKTDQLEGGHLSGKNKTEHFDGDPLSGEIDPASQDESSDLLTQKTETAREKTHWKGHNAYEEEKGHDGSGPASEAYHDGSELSLDRDGTDHQKYYKGHNPAEEFQAKEKKEREGYREDSKSDMSGKSATDEIEGHYGRDKERKEKERAEAASEDLYGKLNPKDKAAREEKEREGYQEEKKGNLGGKSATDEIEGHYGRDKERKEKERAEADSDDLYGKMSPEEKAAIREEREREAFEQERKGNLAGKSSTDEIDGHYGREKERKEKEAAQAGADDLYGKLSPKDKAAREEKEREGYEEEKKGKLGGKSSTDEIDGHYGREKERKEKEAAQAGSDDLYGNLSPKEKAAIREEREREALEEAKKGNLSGRSSTDEIDGHYGREKEKKGVTDKLNPEELSGKSSTDKLEGHYGAAEKADKNQEKARSRASLDYPSAVDEQEDASPDMDGIEARASKTRVEQDNAAYGEAELGKKKEQNKNNKEQGESDPYADLFGSKERGTPARADKEKSPLAVDADFDNETTGAVLPFAKKAKENAAAKESVDPELVEMTSDAIVISKLSQNQQQLTCTLDDFFDEEFIFSARKDQVKDGKIQVELLFQYLGKNTRLNLEGNVTTIEDDGEGNEFITVKISKDRIADVEHFMEQYHLRQNNINAFIQKVRGL